MPTPLLLQSDPLRDLTRGGLECLLAEGERGNFMRLQWLYRALEKTVPRLRASARRITASVGSLQWTIHKRAIGDEAMAGSQAETLRDAYSKIGNLHEAIVFLARAELRGFSHLEKVYARSGPDPWAVVELRPVPQWHWLRAGHSGPWLYNRHLLDDALGEAINPQHFIIAECDDPADELAAEIALKSASTAALWDDFLEAFGIPPMFFVGPPGITAEKERELQAVAENTVSRARGFLPNGCEMLFPDLNGGRTANGLGFSDQRAADIAERSEYLDSQMAIGVLGAQAGLPAGKRSGNLSCVHENTLHSLGRALAQGIAETLQRGFDLPVLDRLHPGEPALAYFGFHDPAMKSASVDSALTLARIGYRMDIRDLSERAGYTLSERPELEASPR